MNPNANDRAQARLDRNTRLNWQPARGFQTAHAMVDALIRSTSTGAVQERVAMNVRTMR